jgi:hypothetical protein
MGLAFTLDVAPSRRVRQFEAGARILAAAGLGLSAFQLASGQTVALTGPQELRLLLASLLLAALAWVLWPALRAAYSPSAREAATRNWRLLVDNDGECSLESPERANQPSVLLQACILPGLILVSLAPSDCGSFFGRHWRSRTLCFGRDATPRETWRCLNVWLVWSSRGRRDRPPGWNTR